MKWVRSNIKHGSRLALFALAIQFVLSFGHFHGGSAQAAIAPDAAQPAPSRAAAVATENAGALNSAVASIQSQPTSDHEPDDICAICAVMALTNAVLFASPPVLLLPQPVEFLYRTTEAEFVHLNSAPAAFQPRAPPAS